MVFFVGYCDIILAKNNKMKKITSVIIIAIFFIACNDAAKNDSPTNPTTKETPKESSTLTNPNVTQWMSWEGGVDVVGVTDKNLKMPNVIFHVANMVNTPVGNAPSGMVLYQPDSTKPPVVMGFVSTKKEVGAYFGPNIFAGTPFEKAPVLDATFDIKYNVNGATAKLVVGGHTFEATFSELGKPTLINRAFGSPMPFYQQGVEQAVGKAILKMDGKEITLTVPPVGLAGGAGAVVSPNGVYAR